MHIILFLLLLVGCGPQQASEMKTFEKDERLLVLVMGGRNSCGRDGDPEAMSMYPQASRALDILRETYRITTVLTCYDSYSTLFYRMGTVQRAKHQDDLLDLVNRQEKDHILYIGHSYGGWLAMALTLQGHTKSYLYTIDPISPVECELTNPTSWTGCQRAPQDLPQDAVAQKTNLWSNFYQTTTMYLHSSEIPQAENFHVEGVGHTQIDNHETVWTRFRALF